MENKRKRQFGSLEMKAIAYMQLREMRIVINGTFQDVLKITKKSETDLLGKLNKKGIIVRLKPGYYLVPEKISPTSVSNVNEMEKLIYLMKSYDAEFMVSGPTAIYYYGYTDQIPNRIYVYNDKISADRNIAGSSYVFMKTSIKRIKATVLIEKYDGIKVPYPSRSRLLIDCLYDWKRYNTIPKAYNWIFDEIDKNPSIEEKLVNDAIRYGNKSVQRRLGYLLDILEVKDKYLSRLRKKIAGTKSIIPWIPNSDLNGSVNKKWGIIVNGKI